MARIQKTIFISYRRKDIAWALNVYRYLTNHGYDVFFDYTSIPSGDFEQIIISNIKARAHFLVILTPTALDRCSEPGDWLRREIETAIQEKRNIIPLFFDGFSFSSPSVSEKLTGQLATLNHYNGLEVPAGFFDEAMDRLCKRYLNVVLDAVLHPVSGMVQEAVRKQQVAANQAELPRNQMRQKDGDEKKVQKANVEQRGKEEPEETIQEKREPHDVKKAEKVQSTTEAGPHNRKFLPTGQKPQRKSSVMGWGIGIALLVVLSVIYGIYSLIKNKPAEPTPTITVTLSPTYTPTPTITPELTATFTPTPGIGSTWMRPTDGMTMMYVPAGDFTMGSYGGASDEQPPHTVSVDAFWMDQTEVTNKMYALCVDADKCNPPSKNSSYTRTDYYNNSEYGDFPVIYVSWDDASAYCAWSGGSNYIVRLPTESEWEKAASWDANEQQKRIYPWGDHLDQTFARYWAGNNVGSVPDTAKVGSYPSGASFYGVLDMAGNVWEWVSDWYDAYPGNTVKNNDYGTKYHVLRGGSWADFDVDARSTNRYTFNPKNSHNSIGFRCVRTP